MNPPCPACNEPVDSRSVYWRVCAGCLARHHPGCWRAGNGCAVCRDSLALAHPLAAAPRESTWVLRVGICAALLLLIGVTVQLAYLLQTQRQQTRLLEQRYDAETQRSRELSEQVDVLEQRLLTRPPLR